jgi:uncharacterized protein
MMSSTEETRAIVSRYMEALVRGDVETLRASFAPQATWTFPGDFPVSGTWIGPDGIIDDFLARMVARFDPAVPVEVTVRNIMADGDRAVAEWTSRARSKDGQRYENDYAVVFRVDGGKIADVREYLDTLHVSRVLFPGAPAAPRDGRDSG